MSFGRAKLHSVSSLDDRVAIIRNLTRQDMLSSTRGPKLRALAGQITRACPVRGDVGQRQADFCELWSVFEWVVTNVRYTGDIGSIDGKPMDLYVSPLRVIEMGLGDCDEHVGVSSALLNFLGWEMKIRVSSQNGKEWSHIYPVVMAFPKVPVPGFANREMVFDTTLGHGKLGQEARRAKYREFPL